MEYLLLGFGCFIVGENGAAGARGDLVGKVIGRAAGGDRGGVDCEFGELIILWVENDHGVGLEKERDYQSFEGAGCDYCE